MKIRTKLGIMMLGIVVATVLSMVFTLGGLNAIKETTQEHEDKNVPLLLTSLALQKDIIQIQQWLTDISATRGMPGFDDGFDEAAVHYASAKEEIQQLQELGLEAETAKLLTQDLDGFYQMGVTMAQTYIQDGTEAGNLYMEKFDPYAAQMEDSIDKLIDGVRQNYNEGNQTIATRISTMFIETTLLFGMIILISIATIFVIQKIVVKPLNSMITILKDIAQGNGDLTKRVNLHSKDELGTMGLYFDTFTDTVRNIIASVKELASEVTSASEELTASSMQSATAAEEIAQTINEIARGASSQAAVTTEGSAHMVSFSKLFKENEEGLEAVAASSQEVNELVGQGLVIINDLADRTKDSSAATQSASERILKTSESSDKISEASSLITAIAGQTNLLALNAAIEAARAGEHGRGFSVVAEEIRKLAEQSASSTMIIDEMVRNLQQNADGAVKTMGQVELILQEQTEKVGLIESKYQEIALAIKHSSESVRHISEEGKQMESKKNEVLDMIQTLAAVAEENAAGAEQASASIQEQTASIEEIAKASSTLSEQFNELQGLIGRFKVD
ncbi:MULTISPECIES: methyl-accepting chemotaxis protein [Desulfitobacterium]|uniref:Methyl-accepting chemotaxis protein n=1 Tax=Desulfitobacterium dehalogenans (strain ATCC 51507 / DSM 9161 / JW/IU-DC1) TaxID=756499 RepID=I4A7Q0_DESDJ|nr:MULTISPECIES: methyl-accepting chemotaxis protein [Desulfitobacterium]AFL99984.1 methyl-accepting chemotaxis protein [Desulfitobacterium dehalogenans ATCC 51507]